MMYVRVCKVCFIYIYDLVVTLFAYYDMEKKNKNLKKKKSDVIGE